jgi:hypothetical protein
MPGGTLSGQSYVCKFGDFGPKTQTVTIPAFVDCSTKTFKTNPTVSIGSKHFIGALVSYNVAVDLNL